MFLLLFLIISIFLDNIAKFLFELLFLFKAKILLSKSWLLFLLSLLIRFLILSPIVLENLLLMFDILRIELILMLSKYPAFKLFDFKESISESTKLFILFVELLL